jgi:hypothetical protein
VLELMSEQTLHLEYCGDIVELPRDRAFTIGRDADLVVDDNLYLHRRFLEVTHHNGMWWLANVGAQMAATISDIDGRFQAWLAPEASMPLVFEATVVRFSAGSTFYELTLMLSEAVFSASPTAALDDGTTTIGRVVLTLDQRLLVVALAEPALRENRASAASLPTSNEAAVRLGWPITKFNRKLDNVCAKLAKAEVRGLHGGPGQLAANRRARLVEYALAVRLVVPADLDLLPDLVAND